MEVPHLERYRSGRDRYTCPNCGICDHTGSCNYYMPPREYFKLHPEARRTEEDWREAPERLRHVRPDRASQPCHHEAKPKDRSFIPPDIVTRSVSHRTKSYLVQFLDTILDPLVVEGLIDDYRLGVTHSRAAIFFQIDAEGRCRTGKMMMYDQETGRRVKDPDKPGRTKWVHAVKKRYGQLPEDWELTQCIFGEHLLLMYPDKPVALVESEKTAVICAGLMPKYLWLATGVKQQINAKKFAVLGKRKVTAFLDVDGFTEWTERLKAIDGLHVTIAEWLLRRRSVPVVPWQLWNGTKTLTETPSETDKCLNVSLFVGVLGYRTV